jgi:Cell Wall Hydrolase
MLLSSLCESIMLRLRFFAFWALCLSLSFYFWFGFFKIDYQGETPASPRTFFQSALTSPTLFRGTGFAYAKPIELDVARLPSHFEEDEPLKDEPFAGQITHGVSAFARVTSGAGLAGVADDTISNGDVTWHKPKPAFNSPALQLAIAQAAYAREEKCLSEAVYFESRSEPEKGQIAVAQVVVNRALSGHYPATVCGVVYQNSHRYLSCQFTFTCEGKSLAVSEHKEWTQARRIARDMLQGRIWLKEVSDSTHYHATYVSPYWAKSMIKRQKIGLHTFYKTQDWN